MTEDRDYANARTALLKVPGVTPLELNMLMEFFAGAENRMPENHACPPGTYAKLIDAELEAPDKRTFQVSIRIAVDHAYAGGAHLRRKTPPGIISAIHKVLGVFQA